MLSGVCRLSLSVTLHGGPVSFRRLLVNLPDAETLAGAYNGLSSLVGLQSRIICCSGQYAFSSSSGVGY